MTFPLLTFTEPSSSVVLIDFSSEYALILKCVPNTSILVLLAETMNGFSLFFATSKYASPVNSTFLSFPENAAGKRSDDAAFSQTFDPSESVIWYWPPLGVVIVL